MRAREDVTFSVGGETLAAWLYRPEGAGEERLPCVILAHGFTGTRGARLDAYAEVFAANGMAALVFDYRHFGDSSGEPRDVVDVGKQLDDWRGAIAFARALPGVDPGRIALWGSSFSGGHVAELAAGDPRIAAAISQAPHMDGLWTLRAAGPRRILQLTVAGLTDVAGALRSRPPHYLPAVGPPGSVAFMTSPDAEPGFRAIAPDGWPNRAAARAALRLGLYRPGTKAARVRCPWLVQVADRDAITPPQPAIAAAAKAPRGELKRYAAGHFDVYVPPLFETVVADQVAFLAQHLLEVPGPRTAVAGGART